LLYYPKARIRYHALLSHMNVQQSKHRVLVKDARWQGYQLIVVKKPVAKKGRREA
jgi:hypothetical protein